METSNVQQAHGGYQAYPGAGNVNGQNHQSRTYYIPPPPPKTPRPIHMGPRGRTTYRAAMASTNNTYHPESTSSTPRSSSSYSKNARVREYDPTPTSRYIHMLLSVDTIPKIYNLLAAFFTWILLAGYVLLPGTFTKLSNTLPDSDATKNEVEKWVVGAIKNTPLLYVAVSCTVIGVIGMAALWARWRKNYVWILNRIFLPGALNSLAGIISTIVNVYTAQGGKFSLTAIVSITVTATSTFINGLLWYIYNNVILAKVQELHKQQFFDTAPGGKIDVEKCELGENGKLVEVETK